MSNFNSCQHGPWITSGDDVQYKIEYGIDTKVYFQCTSSRKDWIDNLDFFITPYRGCKWLAHRGFVRKYKSVSDEIMSAVEGCKSVVFIGYSQGAALALLAHEDYLYRFHKQARTICYACPRVVSWLSRGIFDRFSGLEIINHCRDLVGHVPPVLFGFRHVVRPTVFGECGSLSHKYHYQEVYKDL